MKRHIILFLSVLICVHGYGQGLHFSQYYNAPMLVNPANTALTPDNDFRVGANYRNQWSSIPVPYNTLSVYGDLAIKRTDNGNWLGIGAAIFNDHAGNGNLSLTNLQVSGAYHLQLNTKLMLSGGLSFAYVQRSVDFDKLTFDVQWDGFEFNNNYPNNERPGIAKTSYADVGAGLNLAYFPNDAVYLQIGSGLTHINQPTESFYTQSNKLGMRPSIDIDALFKINSSLIINPSAYYTSQKNASELLFGSMFLIWVGGEKEAKSQIIVGAYDRFNEALVAAIGYEINNLRILSSYDFTTSNLTAFNQAKGAIELSFRWVGVFGNNHASLRSYNCPRFF